METPTSTKRITVNVVGTSSETPSDVPKASTFNQDVPMAPTSNQVEGMEVKPETGSDVANMQDYYPEEEHSGKDFEVAVL